MNFIVVDDDEISVKAILHLAGHVGNLQAIKVCKSPLEAIDILKKEQIDLIFLDIEMPEMSGIEFLKLSDKHPLVILTTTHTEYALEAFEYNIVDYLVKPVQLPRFVKAVSRAQEFYDNSQTRLEDPHKDYFFVKSNSVLTKVLFKDILWMEGLGDYITIHTQDKKYVLHLTLKAIIEKLPPGKFMRVHRSFIVGMDSITSVADSSIYVGNKMIPVGAMYRNSFYEALNLL